jgi:hypothetical protein
VPNDLPTLPPPAGAAAPAGLQQQRPPFALGALELAKPILFECDYDYQPDEDARLTVKWFKDKEAEPIYQWLPELNVRHFADWIRPLVDQTFVSDPHDPLKRFRSLLIRRLSMNLTGQYTCLVSSLASQDSRTGSLVVYQAPRSFTFEHRIYPAPASLVAPAVAAGQLEQLGNQRQQQQLLMQQQRPWPAGPTDEPFMRPPPAGVSGAASPTQFKGLPSAAYPYQWPGAAGPQQTIKPAPFGLQQQQPTPRHYPHQPPPAATIVRPPNNNSQNQSLTQTTMSAEQADQTQTGSTTKIVYTHDGRPIRRKLRRRAAANDWQQQQQQQAAQISSWQLKKKLGDLELAQAAGVSNSSLYGQPYAGYYQPAKATANYAIQLHHFQCQATQVTPRPVMALLVKRGADSIAQYLHESSLVAIRPYEVNQSDILAGSRAPSGSFGCGQPPPGAGAQQRSTAGGEQLPSQAPFTVTLYDITVSATVALNVSLPAPALAANYQHGRPAGSQMNELPAAGGFNGLFGQPPVAGVNTILNYRRGQRMSFECHLELTGTEFEERKRIGISEEGE